MSNTLHSLIQSLPSSLSLSLPVPILSLFLLLVVLRMHVRKPRRTAVESITLGAAHAHCVFLYYYFDKAAISEIGLCTDVDKNFWHARRSLFYIHTLFCSLYTPEDTFAHICNGGKKATHSLSRRLGRHWLAIAAAPAILYYKDDALVYSTCVCVRSPTCVCMYTRCRERERGSMVFSHWFSLARAPRRPNDDYSRTRAGEA